MPVERNASVREIKDSIKLNNKKTGAKLSFPEVQAKVREALEQNTQQDFALIQCYCDLIKAVSDSYLTKRAMANSNVVLYEKYNKYASQNYNIVTITEEVISWVQAIAMQLDSEYMSKHRMTEAQLRAIRDFQLASIRSANYYGELKNCLKSWGRDCYYKEIERINDIFHDPDYHGPQHVFGGDVHNKKDLAAAEIYQKTVLVREELATYNGFWKLVYFRYVKACNAFLEHADNTLREIGFDVTRDAPKVAKILTENVMPPNDADKALIVNTHLGKVRELRGVLPHKSRAYAKLESAQSLECDYETSFEKILEEYNRKYDTELTEATLGYSESEVMISAQAYDSRNDFAQINAAIEKAFTVALEKIYVSALKNGKQINAAEVLADARKIAVLAAQRFSPYFEIEENSELEYPMYLKDKNEEYFKNKIDEFANKARHLITMEENTLRKKNLPIPTGLSKNKSDLTANKINALKEDIASASKQLTSDMAKLVKEDRELAVSLGSKLPKPKKPQVDPNAHKPKPIDEPTEKHLEAWKKFLDISYVPSMQKDLKMQYSEFNTMKVTLIDGNKNVPKDVKAVVELTDKKFTTIARAMRDAKEKNTTVSDKDANSLCQKLEEEARNKIPNYQSANMLDLLKLKNKQTIENLSGEEELKAQNNVDVSDTVTKEMTEDQILEFCKNIKESTQGIMEAETLQFFQQNTQYTEKNYGKVISPEEAEMIRNSESKKGGASLVRK